MSTQKQVDKFNNFIDKLGLSSGKIVDFSDKSKSVSYYVDYMLMRTQSMFEYKGLPDTVPSKYLELYMQTRGLTAIATNPKDGKQYALLGGLGGICNAYNVPKFYIGANPWLEWEYELEVDKDCVIFRNDTLYRGLLPIIERYATMLMENDITIRMAIVNSRITNLITATSDNQYKAGLQFIQDVENGKLSVIKDNNFSPVQAVPYGSNSQRYITQLIELEQYLKSQMFNDVGLNANYNMKRETITTSETMMNNDSLLPLCDDMYYYRQESIQKCNDMFGWKASVDFSSSWKNRRKEIELEFEKQKTDIESVLNFSKGDETDEVDTSSTD